jgi:hypothetical protein
MALAFTLVDSWDDGRRVHIVGSVAASGSYTTGGDTLDLSGIEPLGVPTTQPPIAGAVWMEGLAGYDYVFTPGAALNSGKVKMFQNAGAAGPFAELAASSYPSAVTGDAITFYGIFPRLQ